MGTTSQALFVVPITVGPPRTSVAPPEFHELYDRYSHAVYRTALRVTGNPEDAEDVLQNVFLRVLDRKLALDPMLSPVAYLRRAAANASIDLIRRKRSLAETGVEHERDWGGKESTVFLRERVRRALARLPAEDAELFVMCYLEGYSYEELAAHYQMERGTVGSRLFRIRAVLKKDLDA
jgi:RNA polymerase sigma factor (sigma-70 family)